ncbi:hypothetical protein CKM354_000938700 [Cercospora kikuchii]|uniref:Heme haloperoxidase family profile domain-containing protein n=1 Tax=Cercospora kikuchii TaxID=84275 RepID=A0A9P3CV26_9PEZI|nr:uncharacterized protein CKM354_000938700 [Cercospora kikuchii]GIZ46255.1 hypothetical protein CKM354_000938700 [Cercospora kikuchii]
MLRNTLILALISKASGLVARAPTPSSGSHVVTALEQPPAQQTGEYFHAQYYDHAIRPYRAPGRHDSRGPCPMLNSLANHNYINHDGRNIERQDLLDALLKHVGIEESAVDVALSNAFILCEFTTGKHCGTRLANLTLLALPHAFEHDHSFSREDYMMKYSKESNDNLNFNATIFDTSLDVLKGSSHMTYAQMNEIRLQRESLALQSTTPGWFMEQVPIQEFEAGFIFAVMGDPGLPDSESEPLVRVDWWEYWFANEALPYELGWHRPKPARGMDFVTSASSRILHAVPTHTPSPLPADAFALFEPEPGKLHTVVNTVTYLLPTNTPYRGTIADRKRQASATSSSDTPQATFKNPYVEMWEMSDIRNQQAMAEMHMQAR